MPAVLEAAMLQFRSRRARRAATRTARRFVVIDGSCFKAVNSRDRCFSRGSIKHRMEQEASIERYFSAPETADRQEAELAEAKLLSRRGDL
jgi:hypothetical protein